MAFSISRKCFGRWVGMYVLRTYEYHDRYKKLPIRNTHFRLFFNHGGADRVRNVYNTMRTDSGTEQSQKETGF